METDKEITRVIFRKYKDNGNIIALFPDLSYPVYARLPGEIVCYMRIGQHGEANYQMNLQATTLATQEEYNDLLEELQSIGYNLKVCKRR